MNIREEGLRISRLCRENVAWEPICSITLLSEAVFSTRWWEKECQRAGTRFCIDGLLCRRDNIVALAHRTFELYWSMHHAKGSPHKEFVLHPP
jgi:hypothetical protein